MSVDLNEIINQNLCELPAKLFYKIQAHLDACQRWKNITAVLDEQYTMTDYQITLLEKEESPTGKLISDLKVLGMTIGELLHFVILAEEYYIAELFNCHVPPKIIQNPGGRMHVLENELLKIVVSATGVPSPKYQWYKDNILLPGAASNVLRADIARMSDSGTYRCVVYNSKDKVHWAYSSPIDVIVRPPVPIEIKEHPRSNSVDIGGSVLFTCEAWSNENIMYKWFKDDIPLNDGPNVKGSDTNELRVYKVQADKWIGCYHCQLTRGEQVVTTQGAILQINRMIPPSATEYTAMDKVALLMGTYDYRSDEQLTAPKYDVQTLSSIFQSLGFKVLSLVNLTRAEMIAAVHEFRELIVEDVYCVFYFCGHGFEASNQCFLVPPDAPQGYDHTHSVSADMLFHALLQKKPRLCCMILDICRKRREGPTEPAILSQATVERGNSIVCYGTSYGLASYEDKQCEYGILVSHLKTILGRPIDVEEVFKQLREAIFNDPKVNREDKSEQNRQLPEIRTNLSQAKRSFHDRIVYSGHTAAFEMRQRIWENAHTKPNPKNLTVQFPGFDVKVRLDFQQQFSNALKIYCSVMEQVPVESCRAYVSGVSADVSDRAEVKTIISGIGGKLSRNYVEIYNIQKLKTDMKIFVTVRCQLLDGSQLEKVVENINLGLPLVAKLKLWEKRPDLTKKRMAQEDDEEEDSSLQSGIRNLSC